jgi:hypothetical protein
MKGSPRRQSEVRIAGKKPGRKRIAMIAAAISTAAVVILLAWRLRGREVPLAYVVQMNVVDDSAILVWEARPQGWVSRVDSAGRTLWWRELPAAVLLGGVDGLQVADGIVAVRYSHAKTDHALVAFSFETGQPLWERTLATFQPMKLDGGGETEPLLELFASGRFVGGHLIQWANRGVPGNQLIVVEPHTGDVKRESDVPRQSERVLTIGSRVLLHNNFNVASYNVADGTMTSIRTGGIGCLVDNDYVTIQHDHEAMSLVAFGDGDFTKRRVITASFDPTPDVHEPMMLRRCGTYRDHIVLVLDASYTIDTGATFVVITSRSGAILHTIELPHDLDWDGEQIAKRHYDKASLAGQLTRYVPYVSISRGDVQHSRLYMLDLEAGTVAWRGPEDGSLLHAHLFRGTDYWYLIPGYRSNVVSAFDGSTGRFVTATLAHNYDGMTHVLPMHVGAGKLWMASKQWQPIDRAPVAILDARTLAPAFNHTVELRDMAETLREQVQPQISHDASTRPQNGGGAP